MAVAGGKSGRIVARSVESETTPFEVILVVQLVKVELLFT